MPDLTEKLIAFIDATLTEAWPSTTRHVGEEIPQDVTSDYVWLMQSGESTTEDLCDEVDAVNFDVEVVCTDIATCREWTATIKQALRDEPNWSTAWGDPPQAQFATVSDHDDDYVPRSADSDDGIHIGSLAVTLHV